MCRLPPPEACDQTFYVKPARRTHIYLLWDTVQAHKPAQLMQPPSGGVTSCDYASLHRRTFPRDRNRAVPAHIKQRDLLTLTPFGSYFAAREQLVVKCSGYGASRPNGLSGSLCALLRCNYLGVRFASDRLTIGYRIFQ